MYKASYAVPDDPFTESMLDEGFDSSQEDLFSHPVRPASPREGSVTAAMDVMEITDEHEVEIDLTETAATFIAPHSMADEEALQNRFVDYTEVPRTGAFISATCPITGKSLFFGKKTPTELKRRQKTLNELAIKKNRRSLLSKPLWQLRKDIEKSNQEELKRIEK